MSGKTEGTTGSKGANLDWSNEEGRYHRPRRPVEVRRPARWKAALRVAAIVLLSATAVAAVGGTGYVIYDFGATSPVFRLTDAEAIEVENAQQAPVNAVRERFAADIGQPIFAVPLETRRQSLEEIPWVESAAVQRLFPNRLRVRLSERTPVAFLRQGNSLLLVDRFGVILTPPESSSYNFPVVAGIPETLPRAEREGRVRLYLDMVADLDREGKNYSQQLSEIDVSDPENLRAAVPDAGGVVALYFGRDRYQEKYAAYLEHRTLWQESGEAVRAVDLRYRGQIVLNPETLAGSTTR